MLARHSTFQPLLDGSTRPMASTKSSRDQLAPHMHRQHLLPGACISFTAQLASRTSQTRQVKRLVGTVDYVLPTPCSKTANSLQGMPFVSVQVCDVRYPAAIMSCFHPLESTVLHLRLDQEGQQTTTGQPHCWSLLAAAPGAPGVPEAGTAAAASAGHPAQQLQDTASAQAAAGQGCLSITPSRAKRTLATPPPPQLAQQGLPQQQRQQQQDQDMAPAEQQQQQQVQVVQAQGRKRPLDSSSSADGTTGAAGSPPDAALSRDVLKDEAAAGVDVGEWGASICTPAAGCVHCGSWLAGCVTTQLFPVLSQLAGKLPCVLCPVLHYKICCAWHTVARHKGITSMQHISKFYFSLCCCAVCRCGQCCCGLNP